MAQTMTLWREAHELRDSIADQQWYAGACRRKAAEYDAAVRAALEAGDLDQAKRLSAHADVCDQFAASAEDEIGRMRLRLKEITEEIAAKEAASDRAWARWATK